MQNTELKQIYQWIRHQAHKLDLHPKIHFNTEHLSAYYSSEVSEFYATELATWQIKSTLPALSGNKGSLPRQIYSQALDAYFNLGKKTALDFFSIFNNRYFHFYCQVEQYYDLTKQIENENFFWSYSANSVSTILSSLHGAERVKGKIDQSHLIQYTGLLGMRVNSIEGLKAILQDYFNFDVAITNTNVEYQRLTSSALTSLGKTGNNNYLGMGSLIGRSAPIISQRLQIVIYPRNYSHYLSIYQDEHIIQTMDYLIRTYVGASIKYKISININNDYLPKLQLSQEISQKIEIGKSAWLDKKSLENSHSKIIIGSN